ncbi:MAG: DUF4242 domain-containing protein [Leptolyngbyaceae cyanobacterium SM2_5_2]|nr:DUF4242 domain-containing protein [Leptolyngbyaceae cyanobacterium SM2_5_2]
MALILVETLSDAPLTPENPTDTDFRVLQCLTERAATWRYSLLSSDRHRMICTFYAPDAESVRESYRRAGGVFNSIWTATMIQPEGEQPQHREGYLKVFQGTYPQGFTEEQWDEANRHLLPCYAERGVEWVQSYLSLDRTRVTCELNAPDADIIREAHRRFDIPFDCVWSAMLIQLAATPDLTA